MRIFLVLAICTALLSCKSQSDNVKNAVGDYIRKSTNRPESYEPGTWQMGKTQSGDIHVRHKYRCFNGLEGMADRDGFYSVSKDYVVSEISAADY